MQYLRSVFRSALFSLAIALAVGCTSSDKVLTSDHIKNLRESMLVAAVHVGGGTGWAVWHDNTRVLLITAGHVIHGEGVIWITSYRDGVFRSCTGFGISKSIRGMDLGLVLVSKQDFDFEELPIASDEEYKSVKPGDIVLAAGWPGTRPAMTTVGTVRDPGYREGNRGAWLFHSASGWFGFSGGPVVSASLGKVVGLIVEIRGEPGVWDSSMMVSVRAIEINEFLGEVLGDVR